MDSHMTIRKLIRIYVILSLIALTFIFLWFDALRPYESLAKTENVQYTQKIQWTQTYGGTGSEGAITLLQTIDGGFALAGSTNSYGAGGDDMWLVKTDTNGGVQWNQTFGGSGSDWATDFLQTTDGGFALVGGTIYSNYSDEDILWLKTDVNGVLQWNQTYGGTGREIAWALLQTAEDGGYALAGLTNSYGAGGEDMWLVKTNANGGVQWNQTFGGSGSDWATDFLQTTDGGFALVGGTIYSNYSDVDILLLKTDVNGVLQWNQTYGGTEREMVWALLQTAEDGGYALAGWTNSYGAGSEDMWLIKTDANGVLQWNQTYGGTDGDGAYALLQTADGGFALAGYTTSFGTNDNDVWLVKTDANGVVQWHQTFGGTGSDGAYTLLQTTDGGFALAGSTESFGAGGHDMWLIKTSSTSALKEFIALFFNSMIAGLIIFVVTLFALIIVIKKQKRG